MSHDDELKRQGGAGHWTALTVALIAIYALIMLLTFRDYGITWDESEHAQYGSEVIQWYASGFEDRAALEHRRYRNLGALFDVPPIALAKITGLDPYQARHLFGVLFGLLGLIFTARLAAFLGSPRAGFFAPLALLLTPAYYGHAPSNPKDIPFAALSMMALYYIVTAVPRMPRLPPGVIVRLGLAIGLTLAIRIIGLALLLYLGLAFVLWLLFQLLNRETRTPGDPEFRRSVGSIMGGFTAVTVIAAITMLPWWPSLLVNPVSQLQETLRLVFNYPWNLRVLFEGSHVLPADLPWYYVVKSILITLPEFYLLLLPIGLVLVAIRLRQARTLWADHRTVGWMILGVAIGFPLVSQAIRGAIVYGGWRHFLFVAPVLSIVAGCVLATLVERPAPKWISYPVAALVTVSMILTARDMIRLHPYQSLYFNRVLAGGLKRASTSYETDYWGLSYKEGVEWLETEYEIPRQGTPLKVASCSHPVSTSHFLRDVRFRYAGSLDHLREYPDLILATTRWGCHERLEGRVIHVVNRLDTPILYIKEVAAGQNILLESDSNAP